MDGCTERLGRGGGGSLIVFRGTTWGRNIFSYPRAAYSGLGGGDEKRGEVGQGANFCEDSKYE